jgi:hypothetical protein
MKSLAAAKVNLSVGVCSDISSCLIGAQTAHQNIADASHRTQQRNRSRAPRQP